MTLTDYRRLVACIEPTAATPTALGLPQPFRVSHNARLSSRDTRSRSAGMPARRPRPRPTSQTSEGSQAEGRRRTPALPDRRIAAHWTRHRHYMRQPASRAQPKPQQRAPRRSARFAGRGEEGSPAGVAHHVTASIIGGLAGGSSRHGQPHPASHNGQSVTVKLPLVLVVLAAVAYTQQRRAARRAAEYQRKGSADPCVP